MAVAFDFKFFKFYSSVVLLKRHYVFPFNVYPVSPAFGTETLYRYKVTLTQNPAGIFLALPFT